MKGNRDGDKVVQRVGVEGGQRRAGRINWQHWGVGEFRGDPGWEGGVGA